MVMQVWIIPNKVISEPGSLDPKMSKYLGLWYGLFRSLVYGLLRFKVSGWPKHGNYTLPHASQV